MLMQRVTGRADVAPRRSAPLVAGDLNSGLGLWEDRSMVKAGLGEHHLSVQGPSGCFMAEWME
eukprot:4257074-Lingulodinium_polyedra.AAC.1